MQQSFNDCDYITAKDLISIRAYSSISSANNALHKVRKEFAIKPYGKVTFGQFKQVFVNN